MSTTIDLVRPAGSRYEGFALIAITIAVATGLALYVDESGSGELETISERQVG